MKIKKARFFSESSDIKLPNAQDQEQKQEATYLNTDFLKLRKQNTKTMLHKNFKDLNPEY